MEANNLEIALAKELCLICTKEQDGPIIMNTVLTKQHAENIKKLHQNVIGFADKPCEECQKMMNEAFLIIGFDPEQSDLENLPQGFYRTGNIVGVRKEIPLVQDFIKENIPTAIEKGYCFMPIEVMEHLNLLQKVNN